MTTPNRFTREGFIQAQEVIAKAAEEKAAQRQHAKQKLTARERLALFFDDGVWHEVGQFIGGSVREGRVGSAVAAGYGRVQGRMVAAYAQDFSVLGGTLGKVEGDKIVDLIDRGYSDAYSDCRHSGFGWCPYPGRCRRPRPVRPYFQEDV